MLKFLFKFKNIILLAICILVVATLLLWTRHAGQWDIHWFDKELKIDPTENVVQHIRRISEFTTACYYQEMVITQQKLDPSVLNVIQQAMGLTQTYDKDEIALIVKGQVRAGFRLDCLNKENVNICGDTLFITLPQPKILDVIINPSGYEIFAEDGRWSHQSMVQIQKQAEKQLEQKALREGILRKARQTGVDKLTTIFKTCGYTEVEFSFAER